MFGIFHSNGNWSCISTDAPSAFPSDNFRTDAGKYTVLCEGCVLQPAEFTAQTIADIFDDSPEKLYSAFKGSFVIAIIDNETGSCTVFNDLLSKKPLYYFSNENQFCFSTSFWQLYDHLKAEGTAMTLNEAAVRSMLKNGYLISDITYVSEIHSLMPFQVIVDGDTVNLPIPSDEREISAETAVAELDRLFMEGCRLQLQKNAAAGYRQVFSLSGGMDSKAVLLCAKRLGISPDSCFTYAETGSNDEQIARQIAADIGCDHLFFPMDGGGFLADRESRITANEGLIHYAGTTGLMEVIRQLDCSSIGIVSAGIGGGEIMGDVNMITPPADRKSYIARTVQLLKISDTAAERELTDSMMSYYDSGNQFANLREMRVCTNFAHTASGSFEVASPFLYEDFFCYALSLPAAMRTNRKLYRLWYEKYMPNSYETTFRPDDNADISLTFFRRVLRKLRFTFNGLTGRFGSGKPSKTSAQMNPYDYWWATNQQLREDINDMYTDDMSRLTDLEPWLSKAVSDSFDGSFPDKLRTLTVTWVLNRMNR